MGQLYVTGALGEEKGSKGALFLLDLKGVKGLVILPKCNYTPTRLRLGAMEVKCYLTTTRAVNTCFTPVRLSIQRG
jgi:hypothetical protein